MNPDDLWFNTPDEWTLCRAGGNGPEHPSQLYAIKKFVHSGMSFLDYGSGSATTYEALRKYLPDLNLNYLGLDIIPKNTQWCQQNFPEGKFEVNKDIHKIDQPDASWDVVYSRHVVDHMNNFEDAMDEHCRVAKQLVIVVLWRPLIDSPEHEIKHIIDQGKTYMDEYTNDYSRIKVLNKIHQLQEKGWYLEELVEGVGAEVKGFDVCITLRKY